MMAIGEHPAITCTLRKGPIVRMSLKRYLTASAAAVIVCAVSCSVPVFAQDQSGGAAPAPSQKQLDTAAARAARKAVVGQNMNLTDSESKAFWPLYDEYEGKMDRIEDRHIREIKDFAKNYQTLTDADAHKKLDEVMAIAQARLNVQAAYIPKFRAVLPDLKVTRFFQIDNKLRALVQCQIAQIVPLAGDAAAPTNTSATGGGTM
jgi:hypothetical protein